MFSSGNDSYKLEKPIIMCHMVDNFAHGQFSLIMVASWSYQSDSKLNLQVTCMGCIGVS